jgi:hypothetical protein
MASAEILDAPVPARLTGEAYAAAVRQGARRLKEELIRKTIEDADSWAKAVAAKWDEEHPGVPQRRGITEEEFNRYRDRVRTEDYEWVVPSFERHLDPDPVQFDAIILLLGQIEAKFGGDAQTSGGWTGSSSALGRINDVRGEMVHWAGEFRTNFINSFVTPLENTLPNHRELVRLAGDQMKLTRLIYMRRREAVLKLLDQATRATQAVTSNSSVDATLKWGTIIMVVVGTVIGAFNPGVALLTTGVLLEVGGTVGQGLLPDRPDEEKLPLGAPTAAEVAINVATALGQIGSEFAEAERQAAAALFTLTRAVEGERMRAGTPGTNPFTVPAPAIATATPAQIIEDLHPTR